MSNYSVTDATRIVGISKATVRNYSNIYSAHLSSGANPSFGSARKFTVGDLKVFAYVRQRTSSGLKTGAVLDSLPAGLNGFDWDLPPTEKTIADTTEQLIPNSTLQIWEAEMQKKDDQIDELTEENKKLLVENGELRGELKATKRTWWQRLTGKD